MRLSLNLVIASTFGAVAPASANYDLDSLLEMPLCSLAETKVVSATRTSQSLADTPASVYVITAKEIKRSGARSVADALSLAPGLHVAKYSNYDWGVTVRGNNETLNNKMLVMVDGRSVFNPMSSGVDWDLIPVSMDNIAQIEIVLGPVGTVWGGNAVTGVINVITKEADGAAKGKVSASFGNYDYSEYQLHHADSAGEYANYSLYGEFVDHMPWTSDEARVQPFQHFNVYTERLGGRLDYQKHEHTLSVQAGGIRSREDYNWGNFQPHFIMPGAEPMRSFETEMTMQEYFVGGHHIFDRANGDSWENEVWFTYSSNDSTHANAQFFRTDLDSHYTFSDLWGTELTLGGNVRLIDEQFGTFSKRDEVTMPYLRVAEDPDFLNQSYGVYMNWNIPVMDKTKLTLGNRWQYNNLTHDIDPQPQVRLSYELASNQRIWAGWGKAIVTPSRLELSTYLRENQYMQNVMFSDNNYYDYYYSTLLKGNEDLDVESVSTYELGYRFWDEHRLQFSIGGFYTRHENIRVYKTESATQNIIAEGSSPGTIGTVVEQYTSKLIDPIWSESFGGEVAVKWQPRDDLQINANYSYKRIVGHCEGAICSNNDAVKRMIENEPNHFVNAQVMWDITPQWWVSVSGQYVSESELHEDYESALNPVSVANKDYNWPEVVSFDASLSWQYNDCMPEITASVENLGADQSKEFPNNYNSFANGTQYWLTLDWDYARW
ncbi:TonB-dependent receptor plug domain-containing protein [Vibrio owensii]|uniref:TonB-dependent receptor plug domain-containing protein n=1 Tax=Vibrio owensii TaxID=696485 RepID=UPI0018F12D98|nr:TonB-dependent receptor [Vibrio owensii]